MDQETKDTMEALGISAGGARTDTTNPSDDGIDYKAKYEEMVQKYAAAQVEQGRVKKLNAELKATQSRLAELEKQKTLGELPEELQDVPDTVKETALLLSQRAADRVAAGMDQRMAHLEKSLMEDKSRRAAELANEFVARINQEFPEFAKGLKEGGAFKAAWDEYQRSNGASIREAFGSLNFNMLSYHINRFYSEHDVDPSGGRDPNAAPDPRSMGGGAGASQPIGGKKTYTADQWEKEYDSLLDQYERGVIGPNDFQTKRQILTDAYKEGRVKSS